MNIAVPYILPGREEHVLLDSLDYFHTAYRSAGRYLQDQTNNENIVSTITVKKTVILTATDTAASAPSVHFQFY